MAVETLRSNEVDQAAAARYALGTPPGPQCPTGKCVAGNGDLPQSAEFYA